MCRIKIAALVCALSVAMGMGPSSVGAEAQATNSDDQDGVEARDYASAPGPTDYQITLHGDESGLTEEVRKQYAGKTPFGRYRIYIDADGVIPRVDVVESIPGCDALVAARFRALPWSEPKRRTKLLVPVHLAVPWPTNETKAAPVSATTPAAGSKNVSPHMLIQQVIEREEPHLPEALKWKYEGQQIQGLYYITVGRDGHVTRFDVGTSIPGADDTIGATLLRWKFKPLAVPLRTMLAFNFTVPRRYP